MNTRHTGVPRRSMRSPAARAAVRPPRLRVRGATAALILLAALVAACSAGSPGAPTTTATPASSATATGTPEPEVTTVAQLVKRFGEPADASFARLEIPVLGVDAPVGRYIVGADGEMPAATNPVEVAWYDMTAFPGYGGLPGGGNAIFAGHVDYFAHIPYADGVLYRGKGVFANLSVLSPGDVIDVVYQGHTLRYAVTWTKQVHADGGDWHDLFSSTAGADTITLYTCTGSFNWSTREYSDRLVVRAERTS